MAAQTIYSDEISSTIEAKKGEVASKDVREELKRVEKTKRVVEEQKIEKLVTNTDVELMHVRNVFPFDLFPDTVTLDKNKLSIKYGMLPFVSQTFSMFIKDIKTVQVTTGILFGRLTLEVVGYEQNPPVVEWLWNTDALKVKRVLIGLMAMHSENVDLSHFSPNQILKNAEKIGKEHEASPALAS